MEKIALYAECDYVKLSCKVEFDVVQEHIMPWLTKAEMFTKQRFGIEPRRKDTFLGDWGEGKRLYIFEYSGQNGYVWYNMDYWTMRKFVSRLDAKKKTTITEEGLRFLFSLAERGRRGGRGIGWQKGRVRNKTDKRDGGGEGFYIGSHKSAYRIQVTKRGHEAGYIEFMYKDEKLEKMLADFDGYGYPRPSNTFDQADVIDRLYRAGMKDLCKIVGLTETEVYKILAGGMDTGKTPLERDTEKAVMLLRSLPREAADAAIDEYVFYRQGRLGELMGE